MHISEIDPRHHCKVLTHVGTPDFSSRGEEVPFVFGVWQMPNALVQNLSLTLISSGKRSWSPVKTETLIHYPLFIMQVDGGEGKIKKPARGGLKERIC